MSYHLFIYNFGAIRRLRCVSPFESLFNDGNLYIGSSLHVIVVTRLTEIDIDDRCKWIFDNTKRQRFVYSMWGPASVTGCASQFKFIGTPLCCHLDPIAVIVWSWYVLDLIVIFNFIEWTFILQKSSARHAQGRYDNIHALELAQVSVWRGHSLFTIACRSSSTMRSDILAKEKHVDLKLVTSVDSGVITFYLFWPKRWW